MKGEEVNNLLSHVQTTYIAQIAISLVLACIFKHYSKVYKREFLSMWAWSWFSYTMFLFGTLMIVSLRNNEVVSPEQYVIYSMLSVVGGYLQLALLLIGTNQLITEEHIGKNRVVIILVLTAIFAILSVLIFKNMEDGGKLRYFFRIGLRSFIAGVCFISSGIITFINKKFSKGLGQKLLGVSFILFGIEQLQYFTIVISSILGEQPPSFSYFGIVDLLLLGLIGLGMIIWLLEDERVILEKTNEELDSFLYSTSHDLRAPIASILGLTYLAKKEEEHTVLPEYFNKIEERVLRLDEVVGDVLAYARSKKAEIKSERVDFNELLSGIITDVQFNKGAQKIELIYKKNDSNILYTDSSQLKTILHNLISNAVKYHDASKGNAYIKVDFQKSDGRVVIRIEDNGLGIPKDSQAKVFEMFYRASEVSNGSGLGLYIVKGAVDRIKAQIFVESEEGSGTIFTVVIDQKV